MSQKEERLEREDHNKRENVQETDERDQNT